MQDPVEKVAQALKNLGYGGSIVHSDATIFTVDDASRAIGVPPGEIFKSLIFLVDGSPWLVLMSGINKVHSGQVKRASGGRKVTMASPDYVWENFGFRIGGVPPVGYPQKLPALLDQDLFDYETVWTAAGTDHAFFPIAQAQLMDYVQGKKAPLKKEDPAG